MMPATLGFTSRLRDSQAMLSLVLRRTRRKLMPQVSELGLNDSVWNGIRISTDQPPASVVAAASQMPSQLPSTSLMFWNKPSQRTPLGFTSKR